ncbi:hypothetical protein [Streptomyces sp. NPDC101206]|uniref:hypothetical protein n=1 Tax=Streptomyces sp. NPDC101206 TaxID=3366128 RepID=UPI0037FB19B1
MGEEILPEPGQLPLTPEELKRHHQEYAAPFYKAPTADAYADPLDTRTFEPKVPSLKPPSPFLTPTGPTGPHGEPAGQRLNIEPAILNKAAERADDIHTAFAKPAAALKEPANAAGNAMAGWECAYAIGAAHKQWEVQAGVVAGWLAHIAESLRAGARDHTKTDTAIEEAFRGVKRPRSLLEGL